MDDKYHLPEGGEKQNDISPWTTPETSAPDNFSHDEKIQSIDFSTPWNDDAFSDGEKIEQVDFSSPWIEEPDTPVQSAVSLEKNENTDASVQSAVSLEKNENADASVQSADFPEKIENPPDSSYSNQQVIFNKPHSYHTGIIVAIIFLILVILAAAIYLVIFPMFKGRINIADNTSYQNNSSQTSTSPETFQVIVPDTTEAPATLPPPTEASTPSYMVITGKYTWENAEEKAQEMGGHLASVHSEEEWYAVVEAINQAKTSLPDLKYIWLGATSEIDTNAMTVTFYWADGSDNSWLMNHNAHWYYHASLGISEPSGYDINEYKKNGSLIREPYLMMWLPPDSIAWSLNDTPDVSNYSNYKDSNMGYVVKIDRISDI